MYSVYCKLRDERNLKDADVAKATGITKSTFSDWKSGRSNPKNEKLQKIADYFGVTIDYLTTGKEEGEKEPQLKPYDVFEQLLQKYKMTAYKVAKEAGVTQTALSNWKTGKSTPTTKTLQKLADYFGVTIDYLMTGKEEEEKEPQLKPKDKKDIEEILASTEELLKQDGLMFDGDPASPEAVESILSAMQIGMEMAKKKNKEKYTPKKYKKD